MKKAYPLRFDPDLIEQVKEKAKATKRSFNNYVEYLLYKDVGDIPNEETIRAIEDARLGRNLEKIDDLDEFLESI